jgi:hypothetical protein
VKPVFAALAVIIAVYAGNAYANRAAPPAKAVSLSAGQAVHYAGLTCTTYAGTTAMNADIVCVRDNLRGFGVVVSQQTVVIAKRSGGKVKVVFKAAND